ncbi:hypothetical protein VHEMI06820 [[Torrubiella] hemipterigena]|uniref:HECT-type E3 ubiquitin transferase n=1 Tax=[Torrubiella] hemipterigena TaxID=1531966 RepID=A0A0A1TKC9_9HYPO|nr:hypothetical protein VHEMI06820 [[Torrubiella] hemipterigena]
MFILIQTISYRINLNSPISDEYQALLVLATRLAQQYPVALVENSQAYFDVLSKACQKSDLADWGPLLVNGICLPLETPSSDAGGFYMEFISSFLTRSETTLFENNIAEYASRIDANVLSDTIIEMYSHTAIMSRSKDDLIWLLSHFINMTGANSNSQKNPTLLEAVFTQITALAKEISLHFAIQIPESSAGDRLDTQPTEAGELYIREQLKSLIQTENIAGLLQNFAANLAGTSTEAIRGASILAGYILSLLQCFPSQADDVRMRLFLEDISGPSGSIPVVRFLWQMMDQTNIFSQITTDADSALSILLRYLNPSSESTLARNDEQEWRIILLFLELYIFILRLSDDEDFFSGIYPKIVHTNSSTTRIRSCSLSLKDIKDLTIFLKNAAFSLFYKSATFTAVPLMEPSATSHHDIVHQLPTASPTRLDMTSLRSIITTAMKMLYERDSRKRFLPTSHWLMTDKLEKEDFMGAVMAEEVRRSREEENADSDDDGQDDDDDEPMTDYDTTSMTFSGRRNSRYVRLERIRSEHQRLQRARRLAEMGPKLEILKHMPFVVPFETRVMIFRQFIELDFTRRESLNNPFTATSLSRHHQGQIRRGHLFEDAYKQFYKIGDSLKDPIQITFVDQFGAPEAGIDGGGVTKEFLMGVTSEAFSGREGELSMFASSSSGLLYPNPTVNDVLRDEMREMGKTERDEEWRHALFEQLKMYEFLGRVVGKCLYEGILVDLAFAGFFLLKWTASGSTDESSYKGSINDLVDMDEELYNGMLRLKNYPGDVGELSLDFTVTDQVSHPSRPVKTITRKLIANGDQIPVTNDNRLLYISYVARHRLVVQPAAQTAAFLRGLRAIIRPSWLSMFNQSELQHLVGGDSSEIDIEDLRKNTVYSGLYEIGDDNKEHPTIELFWKVVRGFTDAQRRDLLKYVSSTPRAPLLGFSQLRPKFSIRDASRDETRLPSTSTCVNLLKLPLYTTETVLREKLLYAIQSGAGFDLS